MQASFSDTKRIIHYKYVVTKQSTKKSGL